MNVHYIYNQKIAEIESRLSVQIRKNIINKSSSNKNNNFNNILKKSTNKLSNINSKDLKKSDVRKHDIIDFAKKYLDVPYVWGGNTPKGFDCSGFTKYVMKHFGININRVSKNQVRNGKFIPKNKLKTGDLVFFDTKGEGISHVGMYIGDDKFIHASSKYKKVVISPLDKGDYAKTYVTGRRVLNKMR
ncbi:C40 family peptidase [Tepidibacter formicigenes]|jgi:cell wall-associated NlpC family hydrolase|uniref:NlpC/P60 family protein n=1 Tax=Tepidibacter formicigenes DSM 15518 TaxID=1123349 RepID=A0A1M6SF10_9FIRM|nr:C40 family peptidase [Tepidibacter formicigenes]SHK43311.1 NlpC/P60 family protein [Tepidibacter formicigenes DSM 15518]